jgi:hypothetical protein
MVLDVLQNYKCLELVVRLDGPCAVPSFSQRQQQAGLVAPNALQSYSSAALTAVSHSPQVCVSVCVYFCCLCLSFSECICVYGCGCECLRVLLILDLFRSLYVQLLVSSCAHVIMMA